jgi:hypothetical protein
MQTLTKKLNYLRRRQVHIKRIRKRIIELKYEILNTALKNKEINSNSVDLFHKYNKRLKLITFLKNS